MTAGERSERAATGPLGTLSKSVFALAIVPLNLALTPTSRKAYNVMLYLAQRQTADGEGGFSAPLSSIVRGFGQTSKINERVRDYIEQMTRSNVEWRPLARSEQWALPLEGGAQQLDTGPTDEWRIFPLLAEARFYRRGGEPWVTWYFPPSIREQLVEPTRWAQLELQVFSRLSTYTSIALYEICARYKDSPGGRTSRHPWDFWVSVLRGSESSKPREWRKFKNEFLGPAIAEINEQSDIQVQLIENKQGRTLVDVQFEVRKRALPRDDEPEVPDITLTLRAAKVGVREADLDQLMERHGEARVGEALDALDRHLNDPRSKPVLNRAAYLKGILNNLPAAPAAVEEGARSEVLEATRKPRGAGMNREEVLQSWMKRRFDFMRRAFEALPEHERDEWIDAARRSLEEAGSLTPSLLRRLHERQWQSPLVTGVIVNHFASTRYGAAWNVPTETDLAVHAAELAQ